MGPPDLMVKAPENDLWILSKFDHDSFQREIHRLFGG